MKSIVIKWLWEDIMEGDEMVAWGEGARIVLDGKMYLDLIPVVSREKSVSYNEEEVYMKLFEKMGIKVTGAFVKQNLPEPWKGKEYNIHWLSDSMDCETCGGGWASGAIVFSKGEKVIDLTPFATCYGSDDYDHGDVYNAILDHLGYEVIDMS